MRWRQPDLSPTEIRQKAAAIVLSIVRRAHNIAEGSAMVPVGELIGYGRASTSADTAPDDAVLHISY